MNNIQLSDGDISLSYNQLMSLDDVTVDTLPEKKVRIQIVYSLIRIIDLEDHIHGKK